MGMLLWGLLVGGLAVDQAAPPPAPISPPSQSAGPVETAKSQTGNLVSLFSNDDYPDAAIRNGEQGDVQVRLSINAQGIVDDCTIIESSNSAALDTATCSILARRARFRPARDAAGNAVGDTYTQKVAWRIPAGGDDDDQFARLTDQFSRLRLDVDEQGRVKSCQNSVQDRIVETGTSNQQCRNYQRIVDHVVRAGGNRTPRPLGTVVVDTIVDFDFESVPLGTLSYGTLMGESIFNFKMNDDGRTFASCGRRKKSGRVMPDYDCSAGPLVRIPEGEILSQKSSRKGIVRSRIWAVTAYRAGN